MRLIHLAVFTLLAGCMDPDEPGKLVAKTVDDDPALPSIDIAGTRLHAETFGDPTKPMIMVLHDGPGNDYRYLLPMAALADDYYVVFWDQRGAGLSRRHDASTYSLDAYLEDLRLVIEHYSSSPAQPIVFLGHSWGGMYATWFINTYGDYGGRIRGAVISEPGALTTHGLKDYLAKQFPPWGYSSEELNDAAWAEQVLTPADQERADYAQYVAILGGQPRMHNDPNKPLPMWRSGAVARLRLVQLGLDGFDWTTNLGDYHHHVLFLRGALNELEPLAVQEEMASHFADAEVVTIPGVGHEAMWERTDDCLAVIRPYIAEVLK